MRRRGGKRREDGVESIVTADPYAGSMIHPGREKDISITDSTVSGMEGGNPEFLFVPSAEGGLGAVMRPATEPGAPGVHYPGDHRDFRRSQGPEKEKSLIGQAKCLT